MFLRRPVYVLVLVFSCLTIGKTHDLSAFQADVGNVEILSGPKLSFDVKVDGELFTSFDPHGYDKPIFYPVYGPGQIGMTRNWPMKPDVEGEAHDHPHHKSIWISHEISHVDFWSEKQGVNKVTSQTIERSLDDQYVRCRSEWNRKEDGKTILTDEMTYRFGGDKRARWIDVHVELKATEGDFTLDDTKEGFFALRTHPDLRLKASPKHGVKEVFGKALNSNGETGKGIWGKPAKWVLYQGPIDGAEMSIAMFDHPDNLRHPTTWHARDYGLVAANPFGLHHFKGEEKGSGAYRVKEGESLKLRYRAVFARGLLSAEQTEKRFLEFAK